MTPVAYGRPQPIHAMGARAGGALPTGAQRLVAGDAASEEGPARARVWKSQQPAPGPRGTEPIDASADVVRTPEGNGTPEGVEPGSLAWALQKIEAVKAGLRDDPGRANSVEFVVRDRSQKCAAKTIVSLVVRTRPSAPA